MDNGLIFPYPCVCDSDESVILTALKLSFRVFGLVGWWMRGT